MRFLVSSGTTGGGSAFHPSTGQEPWYSGAPLTTDAPVFLPVSVGGHAYLIEPTKYKRATIKTLRPATDTQPEPGEVSLNNEGLWRRSQQDMKLGAGQIAFDLPDSVPTRDRYWVSKGLNPHPDDPKSRFTMRLLPDVHQARSSTNTNLILLPCIGKFYVADGTEVFWTTDPSVTSPVWTAANIQQGATGGGPFQVVALATDGANVYAALGNGGVSVTAIGATTSKVFLANPHTVGYIGYANGRLLCFNGPTINETNSTGQFNGEQFQSTVQATANSGQPNVTLRTNFYLPSPGQTVTFLTSPETKVVQSVNTGTGVVTFTANLTNTHNINESVTWPGTPTAGLLTYGHPNPNMVWSAITPSPHGIFLAGNVGNIGECYRLQFDANSAALSAPISVLNMPPGELINAMQYYSGAVLLCTSRGFRSASVQIVFTVNLQYGPVTLIAGGVSSCAGLGEFVWFAWNNYDNVSTGTGRVALNRFSVPLVPAYSTDILAGTNASPIQGSVVSVGVFNNLVYFSVSGNGVWGQHPTNFVPSGSFQTGRINFGTTEMKLPSALDYYHDPLPAGASISAQVIDEFGNLIQTAPSNQTGSIRPSGLISVLTSNPVEHTQLLITINNGTDLTKPPVMRRWTLRALVTPRRVDEINLPIILRKKVAASTAGGLTDVNYDVLAEWQYLKSLEASGQIVRYVEGDQSQSVYIENVEMDADKWDPEHHHWLEGICMVRMITVEPSH